MTNAVNNAGSGSTLLSSYTVQRGSSQVILEIWCSVEKISKGIIKDLSGYQISEISQESIAAEDDRSMTGSALVAYIKTTKLRPLFEMQGKEEKVWLLPFEDSGFGTVNIEHAPLDFEEEKASLFKNLPSPFLSEFRKSCESNEDLNELRVSVFTAGVQNFQCARFSEAIVWFEKALFVNIMVEDMETIKACYGNLGNACQSLGNFQEGIRYHEKYLVMAKKLGDLGCEAHAYGCLGNGYQAIGECRKAIYSHQRDLQISKQLVDQGGEGRAYANLGIAFQSLGDFRKAISYHEKDLEIAMSLGDRAGVGNAHGNLGVAYYSLGEYRQAINYHNIDLQIAGEIEDQTALARGYSNLGNASQSLGDFRQAISYYERALQISKDLEDRAGEGRAYGNIGIVYYSRSEYHQAINYHNKDLQIAIEIRNLAGEGGACGNLGNVYGSLGDFPRAIEYHKRHLKIAVGIENRLGERIANNNLGNIYQSLGNYQRAVEYHEKSLQIAKEIGDQGGELQVYANLGNAYRSLEEFEKAVDYHKKHLQMAKELQDQLAEEYAYINFGATFLFTGDYHKAIDYLKKSIPIAKELGDRKGEGRAFANLGSAWGLLGDQDKAFESIEKALKIAKEIGDRQGEGVASHILGVSFSRGQDFAKSEELLKQAIAIFSEIQASLGEDEWKVSIFERQSEPYRRLQFNQMAIGKIERALETCEKGRARALRDLYFDRLKLSNEARKEIENVTVEKMQSIARRRNTLFVYFSRSFENDLHIWVVSGDRLCSKKIELPEGFKTQGVPLLDEGAARHSFMGGSLPRGIDLSSLIFEGEIADANVKDSKSRDGERLSESLETCYQMFITPIEEWLGGNKITIITDATMRDVPFAALYKRNESGEREYLIDKYTITITPSIQIFDLLHDLKPFDDGSALIVADPAIRGARLPGAKIEGEALAKKIPVATLLSEGNATVEALKKNVSKASIIHFACHGSADARINRDSVFEGALCLTNDQEGKELLFAEEIQKLGLKADLVVLSACQTGKGAKRREGVIGLTRAFLGAGVPSVVATHWSISDFVTQEIVSDFYIGILDKGLTKAEALREAILKQRWEKPDRPDLWGAFFLIGKS